MTKFKNKKSGFSMLELVVVMLIMGTLAGIAISKMSGSDTGAIKASMKSDMRSAIATINACYADTLNYQLCSGENTILTLTDADGGTNLATARYSINLSPGNDGTLSKDGIKINEFPTITLTNDSLPTDGDTLVYDKNSSSIGEFK